MAYPWQWRPPSRRPRREGKDPAERGPDEREDRCRGPILPDARAGPRQGRSTPWSSPTPTLRRGRPPAFEANPAITARPWGRIEGVARIGDGPASGAEMTQFADRLGNPDVPSIFDSGSTTADAEGRFVLDRVVPGDVRVTRGFGEGSNPRAWSNGTLVEVRPGETARAEVGGRGRPVIARIAPPDGFDPQADYTVYSSFEIQSDRPHIPYPKEMLARRDER